MAHIINALVATEKNIWSIANVINKLAEDPTARKFIAKGALKISQKFNCNNSINNMEKVLNKIKVNK